MYFLWEKMWRCSNAMLLCHSTLPSQHGTPISHLQVDWDVWTRPAEKNKTCQNLANVKKNCHGKENQGNSGNNQKKQIKHAKTTLISWTWGTRWFKLYFIPGSLKVTIPTFWFWVTFSPSLKEVTELQGNQPFPRFVWTWGRRPLIMGVLGER